MSEHDHLLDPTPKPPPSPWNIANALTMLRILMVPVYGWLLLSDGGDNPTLRFWAAGVFLLAIATDRVDGDIARSRGLITDFGKVADPIADKALMGMAFVGLSILGELWWWVTVLVLVREWGVTLMRFFVIRHGVMPAGRGGKLKTFLQSVTLTLFTLPLWTFPLSGVWTGAAWLTMALAVGVTLGTGIDYVVKARRLRRNSDRTLLKRARAVKRG
jgi:CDP-diacylglycerol---glycerol-3-phosphate 3-phosphatidyltransferase